MPPSSRRAPTPAPAPSRGWRRPETDQFVTQELGARFKAVREAKGLSLAALGEISGVPAATLSRIENNRMSPTFGVLSRVMAGLGVDWGALLHAAHAPAGEKMVSFADPNEGESTEVRGSRARVLHSDDNARALPLVVELTTPHLEEVGGLNAHLGEEFCFVLDGTLVLHIQGYPPRIMRAGASALFDSSIPHAYVAGASGSATVLIVSQRPQGFPRSPGQPAT
ncbi:MAG: helix-turn-helix transcriptional regulator [Burkholderiales bacterium]|nr:helix-turn-helix transcriptional regulator [Burkholderiales bacterium]